MFLSSLKEISYIHAEAYPAGELKHGPIALIEAGDVITINAISGTLSVALSDDELSQRKTDWKGPRETLYASGALWKYAQLVGATYKGALKSQKQQIPHGYGIYFFPDAITSIPSCGLMFNF